MNTRFSQCMACLALIVGMTLCTPLAQDSFAAEKKEHTVFRQAMKNASKEDRDKIKQIRMESQAQIQTIRDTTSAEIAKILGISIDDMPKKEKGKE